MSTILTPGRSIVFPQGAALDVDWGHPLASGLAKCVVFGPFGNRGFCLIEKKFWLPYFGGTQTDAAAIGTHSVAGATAEQAVTTSFDARYWRPTNYGPVLDSSKDNTLFLFWEPKERTGNRYLMYDGNSRNIAVDSTGHVVFDWAAGIRYTSTQTISNDKLTSLGISNKGGDYIVSINGDYEASLGNSSFGGWQGIQGLGAFSGQGTYRGRMHVLYEWRGRRLTPAEFKSLHENPAQLIKPYAAHRFLVGKTSGGAGDQSVLPSGIAAANAFGTSRLDLNITPSGIANSNAFGAHNVAFVITPNGIVSTNAFGTPRLDLNITPAGLASAIAFGNAIVALASGGAQTLIPVGIASTNAFGAAQLDLNIAPSGVAAGNAFGAARLDLNINPNGIVNVNNFGNPSVIQTLFITPTGIASGIVFGGHFVSNSIITLEPVGIVSANRIGSHLISLEDFKTSVGPLTFSFDQIEIDPLMPIILNALRDNTNTWLRDQLLRAKRNIYRQGTVVNYIGNIYLANSALEQTMLSITIPKAVLNRKGKTLNLRISGRVAANANNKRIRIYWNAATLFDSGNFTSNDKAWHLDCEIITESTSRQIIITKLYIDGSNPIVQSFYGIEDALSDISLSVTGQTNVALLGAIKMLMTDLQFNDRNFDYVG